MEIVGVGIDVCAVERVRKLLDGESGARWLERIFTPAERARMDARFPVASALQKKRFAAHVAGLYAAKEAIGKATGKGVMGAGRLSWQEIEIAHTEDGAPYVIILHEQWRQYRFDISISHDSGIAVAVAICGHT